MESFEALPAFRLLERNYVLAIAYTHMHTDKNARTRTHTHTHTRTHTHTHAHTYRNTHMDTYNLTHTIQTGAHGNDMSSHTLLCCKWAGACIWTLLSCGGEAAGGRP